MDIKKRFKKNIILFIMLFALILSLVVSTFSWILESTYKDPTKLIYLRYFPNATNSSANSLSIIDYADITLETRKYISSSSTEPVTDEDPLSISNMIPGQSQNFVLRLTNENAEAASVKLSITDISATYTEDGVTVSSNAILKYIYLEVKGGDGYINSLNPNVSAPDYVFVSVYDILSEVTNGQTATIYTDLVVPTTTGLNSYVELNCRFWFDTTATDFENFTVNFGKFVLSL